MKPKPTDTDQVVAERSRCHNMPILMGHCVLCKQPTEPSPTEPVARCSHGFTKCAICESAPWAIKLRQERNAKKKGSPAPEAGEPLTVESALAELRETLPEFFGRITRHDNEVASAVYVGLHRRNNPVRGLLVFTGTGKTLSEAMAQVRRWKESQK